MKWWVTDKDGKPFTEPFPTVKALKTYIGLYPAWYVIAESEAEPGRIVEVLMLRRAL